MLLFRPLRFREPKHVPTAVRLDPVDHGPKPGAAAGATRLEGAQGPSPAAAAKRGADNGSEATKAE